LNFSIAPGFYLDESIEEFPEFDDTPILNRYDDIRRFGECVLNLQPVDVPPESWMYWDGECNPILRFNY
jgi:hypothetical protein